tara:strand:+ start:549 stop:701 length:153 start_codon:yes stop_codon:yes gene_type:complete
MLVFEISWRYFDEREIYRETIRAQSLDDAREVFGLNKGRVSEVLIDIKPI